MADFAVTPAVLRSTASALGRESAHLTGVLSDLDDRVRVLQAHWDGAAREAYAEAQRQWSIALDDMTTILRRIAQSTEDIADGYVADDEKSASRFTHRS